MVKRRSYEKRRSRKLMIYSIIILFIMFGIGLFYFVSQDITRQELTVNDDTSRPPNHYDFITVGKTDDSNQMFVFVDELDYVFSFVNAEYLRSAGISYYNGNNQVLFAGKVCNQNELIRFTYCDNSIDKTSCQNDIFGNWWYVNYNEEYINFANYYTGDTDGFYYTYSCYRSDKYDYISIDDNYEKKYLYDNTCIDKRDPNYIKGKAYSTEKNCLDSIQVGEVTGNTCSYNLYDDYTCVGSNLYQKERLTDCEKGYTSFVTKCFYGCSDGECLPTPSKTCSYEEFDNFECIDGVYYQEVQQRTCEIGFTLPIKQCDIIVDDNNNDVIVDNEVDLSNNKKDFQCFVCEDNELNFDTLSMSNDWNCQSINNVLYTNDEPTCQALRPELFEETIINNNIDCFVCEINNLNMITLNMPIDWKCQRFDDILYTTDINLCMSLKPQLFDEDTTNDYNTNVVVCEEYEKNENGVCEFCLINMLSSDGIKAYYEDYPNLSIAYLMIILVVAGIIGNMFKQKKNGGKNRK